MAEFAEVARAWKRMCSKMNRCEGCPIVAASHGARCGVIPSTVAVKNIEEIEKAVTNWAAENPEPVYPTWLEWLESLGYGIAFRDGSGIDGVDGWAFSFKEAGKPIPADIAQKLGIEPKEGV